MRRFIESKANQRWLWNATDHNTFGKCGDEVSVKLKELPPTLLATYDKFPGEKSDFLEKIRFLSVRQAAGCPFSRSDLPAFGTGGKLG